MLIKAARRRALKNALECGRSFAADHRWPATALVIEVDPLSLL
jgi:primosomal protein N' (replication factor Y)